LAWGHRVYLRRPGPEDRAASCILVAANQASVALVRRTGVACEGFSPAHLKIGDAWRDHERWALIAPDGLVRD